MHNLIDILTSKKSVLISTIVFILFMIFVLPWISNLTTELIGVSESPDTSFGLSKSEFYNMVDAYGKDGRTTYVIVRWTFDVVWPFVYFVFMFSIIGFFTMNSFSKWRNKLLWVPVLAISFDYIENILASIIMIIYPTRVDFLVRLLQIGSLVKWFFVGSSFVLVFVVLIHYLVKIIRKRKG